MKQAITKSEKVMGRLAQATLFSRKKRQQSRVHRSVLLARALMCALFALVAITSYVPDAAAVTTVPTKMNFQGRITDAAGNLLPNGTYNMRFRIYNDPNTGTQQWMESRLVSASQGVTVTNGLFSVQLGSVTSLPATIFASGAMYFEVELPTPATATSSSPSWTEGVMSPRNQLATSAYAYNAETLDGLDSSSFAQLGASNTFTNSNTFNGVSTFNSSLFVATPSENALVVNDETNNVFRVNTNDLQVVIGTADTSGTVLILDTKTSAGDPATGAVNGAMYYNSSAGKFRCYQAGAWANCLVDYAANNTWTGTNTLRTTSTTAFQVQDANSQNFLQVNTSEAKVTIGTAPQNDTFTKLADPATAPSGTVYGTSFSPDGQYLSAASSGAPSLTIYKRSGDTFTKLPDPATLPPSGSSATSFSPDGQYLSITNGSTPFINIYKRSGDTFTKLPDPATLPPSISQGTSFSPDGKYLTVTHNTTPFISIYKRSGDTFTKLPDPATLPTGTSITPSFSHDSQYLSVAHSTTPFITIYKRSGDTFTKLANPATLPTGSGRSSVFSPDGQYLNVVHWNSPYISMYKRSGDTFTKLANPAALPPGNSNTGSSFSPDGQYVTVNYGTSPNISIYKMSGQKVAADVQGNITVSNDLTSNNLTVANSVSANNVRANGLQINGDSIFQASADTTSMFQVLGATGTSLFNVDSLNSAVTIGASGSTGTILNLGVKTTAGDPTGTNGAMYYNSNAGKFRCYQNGAWTDCIGSGGGGSGTLQDAYNNSTSPATITTTASKGVTIAAGAAPTADMFVISNAGQGVATNGVDGMQINYVGGSGAVEGAGARIDVTPGSTSGSTWNGLKIVANATGAASGVTEYGINLDGPTTPGAGAEVALSIDANWDAGLEMTGRNADPPVPPSGNIYVYAQRYANRTLLAQRGSSGVSFAYQPAIFEQSIMLMTPGGTNGTTGIGSYGATGGSVSNHSMTEQTGLMMERSTGTTANIGTSYHTTSYQFYRGSVANGSNGFFSVTRASMPSASYGSGATGSRLFIGLSDRSVNTSVNTTLMTDSDNPAGNYAGFHYSTNRGDTNWQFITKNNSTQSVANTNMAFAINKLYDFYVYTPPQGSVIYWRIDNLTDGTTQEGSTSSNLPTNNAGMRQYASLQSLSTTSLVLRVGKMYVESDL